MGFVKCRIHQPDGSFIEGPQPSGSIIYLRSFAETVPMIQEMSFKCQARNAVKEPMEAIQGFLYASRDPTSIDADAPMKLSLVRKFLMEGAYLAHIKDTTASDYPTPWSRRQREELRSASYNWLGFMWMRRGEDGEGPSPFEVKAFMYSRWRVYFERFPTPHSARRRKEFRRAAAARAGEQSEGGPASRCAAAA